MTRKKAPSGLSVRGRALWREMHDLYVFNPSEEGCLLEMCRLFDELERLETAMAAEPVVVSGSMGQPVVHPLLADIRAHRLVLAKLAQALNLPAPRGASQRVRRGQLSSVQATRKESK